MSLVHPQTLRDGSSVLVEAGIRDALHHGYPPLGWEGDPRLEVYAGPDNRMYVWRLEDDGEYRLVCRSAPNKALDLSLIEALVTHDVRRGYNPGADIIGHNTRLQNEADRKRHEVLADRLERVYHAAAKDVGHLY